MKQLFSLAILSVAIGGIFIAITSIIKKRKNNEEDIIYSEDFDDYDEDDEEGSYFDVNMSDDEGVNLQEEQNEEENQEE